MKRFIAFLFIAVMSALCVAAASFAQGQGTPPNSPANTPSNNGGNAVANTNHNTGGATAPDSTANSDGPGNILGSNTHCAVLFVVGNPC